MRVTLAQLNPTVGDIRNNLEKIKSTLASYAGKTDIIVFPELFITGYPPRDLLEKPDFLREVQEALAELTGFTGGFGDTGVIIGAPIPSDISCRKPLFNAGLLICGGKVIFTQGKTLLPVYDVFDEERYFQRFESVKPVLFKGRKIGITVCEDMWHIPETGQETQKTCRFDPVGELAAQGADFILNISASPFYAGKGALRLELIKKHVNRHGIPFLFVNQVGANDELIFDGMSTVLDGAGGLLAAFPAFSEHVETVDVTKSGAIGNFLPPDETASVYNALVTGLRDYVRKSGFNSAVVGLSGGIDSAVTCAIAVEALGRPRVTGVLMPSPYTSNESMVLAGELAGNLGIETRVIPIDRLYGTYLEELAPYLPEPGNIDITLQNIQARIRGNILMALSNRYGWLVLSTGNKSETAVGYSTLYGDLAGGLAVISDVPKTMVYRIARHINSGKELIPDLSIRRAPSAELRPGQADQDTLPPYDVLDGILYRYIEKNMPVLNIVNDGYDPETVKWVINAVNRSEYKRRQAPPGLKVTTKAFGSGRRMPIAAVH